MTNKMIVKNLWLGFLSWLIPFVVSFFFFKPGGEMVVPYATFKSFIMVVGVASGCYLMIRYFKHVETAFMKHAWQLGLSWLAINLLLDLLILMPIMKTTFPEYFMSIGLSYLAIPVLSLSFGYLLTLKSKHPQERKGVAAILS